MPRIISTPRLAELISHAGALPLARGKAERLEKELDAQRDRVLELQRKLDQDRNQYLERAAAIARTHEERLAAAKRSSRTGDQLLNEAQERANRIERLADEKVRELKGEIEGLKAQLAANPVSKPEGVVARYRNLVGADIDLTLYVKERGAYGSTVTLLLVSLCSGCGYREEENRIVSDTDEGRISFMENRFEGGKLKGWAQEHAETCRAVALPGLVTA
ncbi:hypothetical protein [Streptomyces platensis]|uniref:DivIVA domain-containing protein n=1 Tax=Streptomyces platensis TaxID=58346 RepID=UPI002F90CD07|nr:DivIVA domain-containing protein [Streptomyces platensis]